VRDRASLLAELEEYPNGILSRDLVDTYHGASVDMADMICSGDVLAVTHKKLTGENTETLFPRGLRFLFRVGGATPFNFRVNQIKTTKDLRPEVRRGDALKLTYAAPALGNGATSIIGRVSTRTHGKMRKWARPISVSSLKEIGDDAANSEWASPFSAEAMPVEVKQQSQAQALPTGQMHLHKFGCTNDVRALWLETAASLPKTDPGLLDELEKHGAGVKQVTHKRARPREKQKKVQRRRRINITNRHLL